MGTFIWNFAKYALASIVVMLAPSWLNTGPVRDGGDILMGIGLVLLVWVGPAIVLGVALYMRSRARVLGAVSGVPLFLLYCVTAMQMDAMRIRTLEQRQFLPAQSQHTIVAIENSIGGSQSGFDGCDKFCQQILYGGRYVPAVGDGAGEWWRVFQLASGQGCKTAVHVRQRYDDACIVMTYQRKLPDALVIRENFDETRSEILRTLPARSYAYELLERIDGQETVLGRWIDATVWPPITVAELWGLREFKVGEYIDPAKFYAAALNNPVK